MSLKTKNNAFLARMLGMSLLRRRSRMAVALVGIAIGATVLLGMASISYDIPRQMSREFRSYGANMVFVSAAGAQMALADAGITLYGGVSGSADAAAKALAEGNLTYDPDARCDHHEHHGGDCSHHHCGEHNCAGN